MAKQPLSLSLYLSLDFFRRFLRLFDGGTRKKRTRLRGDETSCNNSSEIEIHRSLFDEGVSTARRRLTSRPSARPPFCNR